MSEEFPGEAKKTSGNYIFPNIMARAMKGVSIRTQFESSLLSMAFILLGIIFMAVYVTFFTSVSIWIKIMTDVNALAAFVFLSSMLVTSFQQYQAYLNAIGALK